MLTLILSSIGFAVPLQVTQQGRILDSNGAGVSGLHDLTFRIYDAETSGTLLWEETITESMTNGYYAAVLGTDETNNPLDSNILELYPIYLEFQLDSNSPVATRQAINSAPYAQIAGKAEVATSVNGGSVNATDVQISGNPVIDGTGSWVGQPITVDWNNIDPSTIPSYLADGDDNTQLSKTEVLNYVDGETLNLGASSQVDGSDIVTADSFSTYLPADADTLASLNCATGEIASWDGNSSWVCTSDNTLEWADIELLLNNNPVDLNASTTIGGAEIITTVDDADTLASLSCSDGEIAKYDSGLGDWYCDVDVDTTLTSTEVTTMVEAGSVNLATGSQVNSRNIISQPSTCSNGQVLVYNSTSSDWECGDDTDTTLTPTEMQAAVEAMSLNLQNLPKVNGDDVLTTSSSIAPGQVDGTSGTNGQVLTTDGSSVTWEDAGGEGCTVEETIVTNPVKLRIQCGSNVYVVNGSALQASSLAKQTSQTYYYHCALSTTGAVSCWGTDGEDQVSGMPTGTYTSLDSGYGHSCVLDSSGNATCWGDNSNSQVSTTPSTTFTSLAVDGWHTCGITSSGSVECWGKDNDGQSSNAPSGTFSSLTLGPNFSCGINTSGGVQCWGENWANQVSNVPSGTFTTLSTGYYHICGITTSGGLECWGYDASDQVSGAPSGTFTSISSGYYHSCAIDTSGGVQCWGNDGNGQVSNTPAGTYTAVTSGRYHNCAINTSGGVECWGQAVDITSTPTTGTFVSIQANANSTCGILDSGNVICWGISSYNQTSPP